MTRNTLTVRAGDVVADFATPLTLTAADCKRLGIKGVIRYIDGSEQRVGKLSWKSASKGELAHYHKGGIATMLVFERSTTRHLGGAVAGAEDGKLARESAKALGYPTSETILIAFDTDVTSRDTKAAVDYFNAFRKACLYPVGVYGDYQVIDAVKGLGSVCNIQPNAAGWSGFWVFKKFFARTHPAAHALQQSQRNGYDPNNVLRPFAMWLGPPPPAPPFDPAKGQWGLWPLNRSKPTISKGLTGDAVRYLQGVIALKAGGGVVVTGVFDAQTEKRVKDLQRYFKITEDGIVGMAETWPIVDFLAVKK